MTLETLDILIFSALVNLLPLFGILFGAGCIIGSIHQEMWGTVIVFPKLLFLGIFILSMTLGVFIGVALV
jgi:hypothetical protein